MKLGVTSKLFLAILATCIVVALAMGAAMRLSFTRGFLGYLNDQELARLDGLIPELVEVYREHGSWQPLRDNRRAWWRLLRPHARGRVPDDAPPPAEMDAMPPADFGLHLRLSLLDAEKRPVAGNPRVPPSAVLRPIEVDGRVVGYLAAVPFRQVTGPADLAFQERQLSSGWIIAGLAVLLAALVAMGLARLFLAPVKRIAAATHKLAAGDYATRVEIASGDELGRLAGDFNRLAVTLEKNERMRRAMMADVSHELRTPLAVLRGELEALEDGVRPLTKESVKSLQTEVAALSKLVDDLYELSLADVGALSYRKQPLDLAALLAATAESYRDRLAERRIALDLVGTSAPLTVLGDEGRLRQLFGNLLENVLRYTDPGGTLRIACAADGREARVDFQDSSPGVPEEVLPRLFDRFYRVEGSRGRASGGAGLGLALCRGIVEAHAGRIEARASPLGGLWLAIRLPRHQE